MEFFPWVDFTARSAESLIVSTAIRIASRGMCCSVGHNALSATAAIRARMNHFRDSQFVDESGVPLKAAAIFELDDWGEARLEAMLQSVLVECLDNLREPVTDTIPVLLLVAEQERGERYGSWASDVLWRMAPASGHHPGTGVMPLGKAGFAAALARADALLSGANAPSHVVLMGVDSLLDVSAIEELLAAERLLTSANSDGLIPGEGAGAIVLSKQAAPGPALWIEGYGESTERASVANDEPNLGRQLASAMRRACEAARMNPDQLSFCASGANGEAWYFSEVALALTRILERKVERFPHRLIAQWIGDTGAACGPLTLAWLLEDMARADGPGQAGLISLSNDNGLRSAAVVRFR